MSNTNKDVLDKLNNVLSIVPPRYVNALITLHERLDDKEIAWIVNGDLAECLRTVQVEADGIEIVTSKVDAERIFQAFEEFKPRQISLQTQRLPRDAVIEGKELPVYVRSYYFDFNLNTVKVKVQGDLQFKVGDWDWGDVFEFTPEYVYVVGKKTAVTPLSIKAELYRYLGWNDRFEKIKKVIQRPLLIKQKKALQIEDFIKNQS